MRLTEEEITKARESGANAARDLRAACSPRQARWCWRDSHLHLWSGMRRVGTVLRTGHPSQ